MARTTFFLADMSRVDKNQKRGGVQGLFSLILSFTQFTRELLLAEHRRSYYDNYYNSSSTS